MIRPMEAEGRLIQVGAFVGIAAADPQDARFQICCAAPTSRWTGQGGALRPADMFDEGMERALIVHSEIEQGIRLRLDHGQFIPFYEPQSDLLTGEIIGFECWRGEHPLSGPSIPTASFRSPKSMASSDGFRRDHPCRAYRGRQLGPDIKLSVNISPMQLADSWLAQRIVRLLAEAGFPAERLVVEITESSLFADLDLARTIVTTSRTRASGSRSTISDRLFSSLRPSAIAAPRCHQDRRTFVATMPRTAKARHVRAVTTLAEALSVPVTVEGIDGCGDPCGRGGLWLRRRAGLVLRKR